MAKRSEYADKLRDALLALALVPIAGLHTATYWLVESERRTTRLATELLATTAALARSAPPSHSPEALRVNRPLPDVLAHDLLEAARTYVQSMVRLPADASVYFTGEVEGQLRGLLAQIQPDAATDLGSYLDGELEGLLREFDRLSLVARAELPPTARHPRARRRLRGMTRLADQLDGLRAGIEKVRHGIRPEPSGPVSRRAAAQRWLGALNAQKARTMLQDALRDAQALVPDHEVKLRVRGVIAELERLATSQSASTASARRTRHRRPANG